MKWLGVILMVVALAYTIPSTLRLPPPRLAMDIHALRRPL